MSYMKTYFYLIKIKDKEVLTYIGSTNNFSSRKSHHKKNVRNKVGKLYHTLLYKTIRENGGWENVDIVILETKDLNKTERFKYESELITKHNSSLNVNKPCKNKLI